MKDLFGQAIYDYHFNNSPENLYTETTISEEDEMEVSYLFREFNEMPIIEQKAITSSNASEALGKVEKKSTLMEDTLISVTNLT